MFALIFVASSLFIDMFMPYNKKLWSTSFAFLTIGISGGCLSLITLLMDIVAEKYNDNNIGKFIDIITRPFVWLGMNPLAIFFLMDMLAIFLIFYIKIDGTSAWHYIYQNGFHSWITDSQWCSTVFSLAFALLWTIFAFILFKLKIFIKL
jgi:predicted acyltransferase